MLLIWVSPGSGTPCLLARNMITLDHTRKQSGKLRRSLEVDQLCQISQLPQVVSPFKMGALSSRDSWEQGTVLQALTGPAYNRSGPV